MAGKIYCGDNLEVLSLPEFFQPEMVDLVYADPPFNSQRTYNIVYKDSNAQDEAFKDFWTWTEAAPMYSRLMGDSTLLPRSLKPLLEGLHARLIDEDDDLLAYLTMMLPRLVAMHRVLKRTGSLYLHCDSTASHYLKVSLDAIFGSRNFRNEIVWRRTHAHGDSHRGWGSITDTLLMYSKTDEYTFNPQSSPFDDGYIDAATKKHGGVDTDGRVWQSVTLRSPSPRPNLHYPYKASDGVTYQPHPNGWSCDIDRMKTYDKDKKLHFPAKPGGTLRLKMYWDAPRARHRTASGLPERLIQNLWSDIPALNSSAKERLGYPTQKPLDLLTRIISASSNHGDIVLDPFCGCGTTVEASERLGRRWFGIDIAKRAVDVIEKRFARVGLEEPEVVWQPADKDAAHALGVVNKHGFEKWSLRRIRAARVRAKDRGIDGEALFKDGDSTYHAIVSVKAGGVKPADVRDLRGTLDRERAPIGVFVTRLDPSDEMKREAVRLGFLDASDAEGPIPRLQFVSVERMFGPLPPIRCPGKNVTEMPKPTIPPPPVVGEQLGLDIDHKVRDARGPAKAKARSPGTAKARPYERPDAEIKAVAEKGSRPPKGRP
jgi:site-specific DNA-methyltransferase (adenine-specific)